MTGPRSLFAALAGCLLLAACSGAPTPPPSAGGFTIAVSPASFELRIPDTATLDVTVQRTGDFTGQVTLAVSGPTTGLAIPPVVVSGSEAELSITALDTAVPGERVLSVTGTSGTTVRHEQISLLILEAAGTPDSTAIDDGSGPPVSDVRQGLGNVTLTVTGRNLMLVTGFSLGSLNVTELPGRTAEQLQLSVEIGHGAEIGAHDLVLTSGSVNLVAEAAMVVTPVTVAETGSDAEGRGTTESPFRSLTRALTLAAEGDTILLTPGIYAEANGEVWPLLAATPNVPAGVRIEGTGASLVGPGPASGTAALSFSTGAPAVIRGLSVSGFEAAFLLSVAGSTAELRETSASGSRLCAQVLAGSLLADTSSFTGCGTGLALSGPDQVELISATVADNADSGIVVAGGELRLLISESVLADNGMAGLWFAGGALKLRDTEVRGNAEFGIYVAGQPVRIDLGTFTEAGGNSIHGNGPGGTGDQLLDARTALPALGLPVIFTISDTTFSGGVEAAPDVYVGPWIGHPLFSILGANNTVQVY